MGDLLKKLQNRALPILIALGASVGLDPDMTPTRIATSLLVLLAGVLIPSPWEKIARTSLRSVVDAWDRHAAMTPDPVDPAMREVAKAMDRARRVSLPPPNGEKK